MSGRVVHFEIPYDDGDRARDFYKEIFDWQLVTMPEMGGYTLVTSGPSGDQGPTEPGFINGGMLSREQAATTGPVIVVDVASIDESLEKISGLGGAVVAPKSPVGDMGFAAYVTDPEGNVIGLWESAR
jgi:predicted enzyme related to lactoylglutathione lyase